MMTRRLVASARQFTRGLISRRRVSVPTVLQMEAVECGAAALAMVLAYYGRFVGLEELRVACGVSRDGSKASNMVRAARTYGLLAKGYKKEPEDLRVLLGPMVVHWNFNHFVVLEGFWSGRAFLNDPAAGPRSVSEAEFDQSFTGVALTFEPGPDFVRGGEKAGLLMPLGRRLRGSYQGLMYAFLAGVALVVPGMLAPVFNRLFVDDILVRGRTEWLPPLLMAMGLTAAVVAMLTSLQQHYLLRLETKLAIGTASRFFWHVLRLPLEFFSQRFAGEIATRVTLNDRIAALLSGELATTLLSVVLIMFYATLMSQYDRLLAVIGVATALLNLATLQLVSRRRVDLNARLLQDRGKLMGSAMSGLQTIETLKATGSESDFFGRWSGYQAKVTNAEHDLALYTLILSTVPPVLLGLNTALLLGLGGMRVMDGHLSMGMLIAFQTLMIAFITPVNRFVALGGTLQEVRGDMNRLDDVLRAQLDPVVTSNPLPQEDNSWGTKLTGHLELRAVTFGYSRLDAPLLTDFALTLRRGSRVALVGGSGSGKSTVARLVAGLHQPWSGDILFDGLPRQAVPREVMASSFAVVDQDVSLFDGSLRDNVTLWDDTVPDADLVAAVQDAAMHDEVMARMGGYAGSVAEGGQNFSGGQRQRIEIARALANNPTLIVLDEATSALDPGTEKIIDDHLRRRGITCLIVAHRLSTIRDCDEIVVLDRGSIVQRGTHDTMAHVPGPYAALLAAE